MLYLRAFGPEHLLNPGSISQNPSVGATHEAPDCFRFVLQNKCFQWNFSLSHMSTCSLNQPMVSIWQCSNQNHTAFSSLQRNGRMGRWEYSDPTPPPPSGTCAVLLSLLNNLACEFLHKCVEMEPQPLIQHPDSMRPGWSCQDLDRPVCRLKVGQRVAPHASLNQQ